MRMIMDNLPMIMAFLFGTCFGTFIGFYFFAFNVAKHKKTGPLKEESPKKSEGTKKSCIITCEECGKEYDFVLAERSRYLIDCSGCGKKTMANVLS